MVGPTNIPQPSRAFLPLLVVFVLLAPAATYADASLVVASDSSKEAYVTLVYGEPYILGVRVLGQSLRETGTTRDLVALVTGPFSSSAEMTLMMDGWKVKRVNAVQNPGKGPQATGYPPRFWAVYTKLLIFQLTEYRKVVYMDADVLVMRNMDVLFSCPGFCAALRHSERFNTGVMAVEPSQELFEDMMRNINAMPSYTGGDQGFLNAYFTGFAHSDLFDPAATYLPDQYKYMRLPTTFNADIGLYVVNSNRWMLPRDSLYVIHYTLGTFKPWVWWTPWLIRETAAWQEMRSHLPADSHGLAGGQTHRQLFAQKWLALLPPLLILFLTWPSVARRQFGASGRTSAAGGGFSLLPVYSLLGSSGSSGSHGHAHAHVHVHGGGGGGMGHGSGIGGLGGHKGGVNGMNSMDMGRGGMAANGSGGLGVDLMTKGTLRGSSGSGGISMGLGDGLLPRVFAVVSVAAGFGSFFLGLAVTLLLVPVEVNTPMGWVLTYEWGLLVFGILYGSFLLHCHNRGRQSSGSLAGGMQAPKGMHKPWSETWGHAALLGVLLLLAPWVGRLLGINSFIGNIAATTALVVLLVIIVTAQFLYLPGLWFAAGRLESLAHYE